MDEERRADPDALLRIAEGERQGKGKLKVFFGMAAGVGKTFAMLKEAERQRAEGIDVVIGYLESHQRRETDELAAGIEVVPRMSLEYRGKVLQEMDVDAVKSRLAAHAHGAGRGLALVDELIESLNEQVMLL